MIQKRLFLVGCPRSGTTLLQSLLAAHSQIWTCPETFFFGKTVSQKRLYRYLGLASKTAKSGFGEFLDTIGIDKHHVDPPKPDYLMRSYADAFVRVLDGATLEEHKSVWIEKTPIHLYYIKQIERYIPDARFIHVIRHGPDVVASFFEVTHTYPDIWGGAKDVDGCIRRWVSDIRKTAGYADHKEHYIVRYEDLTADPKHSLSRLCAWIGLPFEEDCLINYRDMSERIMDQGEHWKKDIQKPIASRAEKKFKQIFDRNKQDYITEQLSRVNMKPLGDFMDRREGRQNRLHET